MLLARAAELVSLTPFKLQVSEPLRTYARDIGEGENRSSAHAYAVFMHIEELRASQILEVVQLWHDAGLTRPWNDPAADARQALATETSTVLVVVENNAIIASAMVGFDGHKGWVYYVAVAPDQQGRGLGRIIMDAAIEWLEKLEVIEMMLLVREDNEQVQGFYKSLGFVRDEVFVMSRRLQP